MFTITCRQCENRQLVNDAATVSTHHTSKGLIGYITCNEGHTVMHRFEDAYPWPEPPASVVAYRLGNTA